MPDIQKKLPPQTGKFGISERFGDTNNQLSVASFSGKQKSVRKKTKPPGLLHNLEGKPDVSALKIARFNSFFKKLDANILNCWPFNFRKGCFAEAKSLKNET